MSKGYTDTGKLFLDAADYAIFSGMLSVSVAIGLYFAIKNRKKPNTASEYLTANKELSVFPIAMSLCASYISAVNFLGPPAEVYIYGSQVMIIAFDQIIAVCVMLYIFVPVFHNLNIISSYEYLTKRFNYKIGMLGSGLFLIKTILYSSVITYTPAIALSQLTGWNLEIIIPVFSIACIFYTSIGGLRAVVWTDTFQTIFMLAGAITVTILGINRVDGFTNMWERNERSGRIEFFNFDPDPRKRTSFWTVTIGVLVHTTSEKSVNQMIVQRCLSLSNFKKVKMASWTFAIFLFTIMTVNALNGLVAFAVFYDCDPLTTKVISKPDQIIPYLWMLLTREIPTLPGLFVSTIFSACLSSISTNLNSMAGVFVIDILKPLYKTPITEAKTTLLMKIMVIVFGCIIIVLALVIDQLGGVFQMTISFLGLANGPLFGMFILGMFCPRVNAKAVLVSTIASFGLLSWIFVGAQIAISQKQIIHPKKSFSIEGCDNITLERYYSSLDNRISNFTTNSTEPFPLYAVSYQYYTLIGCMATVVTGLAFSYINGFEDNRTLNINLYSPIIRKFIRGKCEEAEEMKLNNTD